jgi:hypothetical protein
LEGLLLFICLDMMAGYLPKFLQVIASGTDAVFDAEDPLPFLALHYLQVYQLPSSKLVWIFLVLNVVLR